MTHSDAKSNTETVEEVDPFDMDMDSIPDAPEDNPYSTEQERADAKKTDQEIQLDQMDQLLKSRRCNTWERGFCDSCIAYLKSKPTAQLSYKQKDVLAKTWAKYSME